MKTKAKTQGVSSTIEHPVYSTARDKSNKISTRAEISPNPKVLVSTFLEDFGIIEAQKLTVKPKKAQVVSQR